MSEKIKALYTGELKIGDLQFPCSVLSGGIRILTQSDFMTGMGMYYSGWVARNKLKNPASAGIPHFLAFKSLEPFVNKHLGNLNEISVKYLTTTGNIAHGIKAEIIPKICEIWMDAEEHGKLGPRQKIIAQKAKILMRALAHVGIVALVDEATGYIKDKKKDEYKELFYQFVRDDLTEKYAKPLKSREGFWDGIYKIYGIKRTPGKNHPQFFGKFLRKYLYAPLLRSNGAILEIIDEKNPIIVTKSGIKYRKNPMYQFLEKEVAFEEWKNNLIKVETILEMSTNQRSFESIFAKVFKIDPYSQTELPFVSEGPA